MNGLFVPAWVFIVLFIIGAFVITSDPHYCRAGDDACRWANVMGDND